MDEADYWASLEFRICREFAAMTDHSLRHFWCDGFNPIKYSLTGMSPRITGQAWICNGPKQAEWNFTLHLIHEVSSREEIDWQSLLPPENMTRWLAVDLERQHIDIEPAVAVPDLN